MHSSTNCVQNVNANTMNLTYELELPQTIGGILYFQNFSYYTVVIRKVNINNRNESEFSLTQILYATAYENKDQMDTLIWSEHLWIDINTNFIRLPTLWTYLQRQVTATSLQAYSFT